MALQSMTALKSMSIEKLVKLKNDVEETLAQKVTEERRSLQQELTKLGGYTAARKQGAALVARLLLSIAIPKPERPGQDAD